MKTLAKYLRNTFRLLIIEIRQLFVNVKYLGFVFSNKATIKWRMMLLSHSLEKGISLCDSRIDFGKRKAKDLFELIKKAEISGNNNCFEFNEACSILQAYKDHRDRNKLDTFFLKGFDEINEKSDLWSVGVDEIYKKNLFFEDSNQFYQLCKKRHSVREYSNEYVNKEIIIKAIDICRLSPSACNRQMTKVFFSMNKEINQKIADYIPGNSGTKNEKAIFLFICSDITAFDYFEVYQWYLNAGIFSAYLTLSLTSLNVASCIYQWPIGYKYSDNIKKMLSIPSNYEITTVLSVGNYKDKVKVLKSERKKVEEYFKISNDIMK